MPVHGYAGLPRSGKSYSALEHVIIPALRDGRRVVHNMLIDADALIAHCGGGELVRVPDGCTAADLVEFCNQYPGAVFVFDEPWRWWPAGLKADKIPETEREFFAMHAHKVGQDGKASEIVLITQDLGQVASFIRALVHVTYRTTKLDIVGQPNRFRVDVYQGAATGPKPPEAQRVREMFGTYDPKVYRFYCSHTQSVTGVAGKEVAPDKRANILKGWQLKFAAAALVAVPFCAWGALHMMRNLGHHEAPVSEQKAGPEASAVSVRPLAVPVAKAPAAPAESAVWRLSGFVDLDGRSYYLVSGPRGSTRRILPKDCKRDGAGNAVCTVAGELVAEWTGTRQEPAMQAFTSGALASATQ